MLRAFPFSPAHYFLSLGSLPADPAAWSWSQHPLSSATLLQPSIGPQLVDRCCSELQNLRLSRTAVSSLSLLWTALLPFFSFVLLQV